MSMAPSPAPRYELERWRVWEWQKIRPEQGMHRYYRLILQQDLWGDWELIREWGRIGRKPSRVIRQIVVSPEIGEILANDMDRIRQKRGYRSPFGPLCSKDNPFGGMDVWYDYQQGANG